jgi:hypothetical protein
MRLVFVFMSENKTLAWDALGALGGTRTPNLLIRRSIQPIRPVRLHSYQASPAVR